MLTPLLHQLLITAAETFRHQLFQHFILPLPLLLPLFEGLIGGIHIITLLWQGPGGGFGQ